ncbi:bifunctional glycogen debranching protein GlgX/4-alpha-glucanotransferase [Dehalobacterium formicoaceticum]|uniref:bifunctional glycogen debranching protein GlgX/4-alpha-glucanotransferase n=1 Tax=Dehalobacterium formicoaceticum TaxID=51515 RepID=UPI000B801819|nr:bifunctional glycogen debranching protein GlgX/4-alpha-glucanotransferase [Dehalobacterium formicoaceticum]
MLNPKVYHDSHASFYRHPFGAVPVGTELVLRMEIISRELPDHCFLRLWGSEDQYREIPMEWKEEVAGLHDYSRVYEVRFKMPEDPGLVWYSFRIQTGQQVYYYGNNQERLGGMGLLKKTELPAYQITVFIPNQVPKWYKEGVMYQIFVDRFRKGADDGAMNGSRRSIAMKQALLQMDWNDTPFYLKDEAGRITRWNFFGGNLTGVLEKLDYLESLGVSIIYFNPIFEAASNHKYDTADYLKIDGMFGDEEIFRRLVEEAGKRGIAIILDGVFSHTGANSIYFDKCGYFNQEGAFQSPDSPYASWYNISEDEAYECWWGVEDLPNVNEMEPSYQEFIFGGKDSVVRHWINAGVKGWRLDVVDELPDEFVKKLRQGVKETDPEAVLIGEVWEDASNKVSYGKLREYFWGEELDSAMNYPLRSIFLDYLLGTIKAVQVHNRVMSLYENYPRENFLAAMNVMGSHDRKRALTILGEAPSGEEFSEREKEGYRLPPAKKELGVKRLKLLSLLQMTFPGVPCVYYGDEAGMEGYTDPYNRGPYPWGKEDQELLSWYRRMIRMRREYPIFQECQFFSFYQGQDVYGYSLRGEGEGVFVLVNRHLSEERTIEPDFGADIGKGNQSLILDLLAGTTIDQSETFLIPPLTGRVIYYKELPAGRKEEFILPVGCGVLLHITSLPSPWGVGDFGQEAYQFADFLSSAGQTIWQVLPLHPPGFGHSPYQSFSAFAGNELFIDTGHLVSEGLLKQEEVAEGLENIHESRGHHFQVDFSSAEDCKDKLFRKALRRFKLALSRKKKRSLPSAYLQPENYANFQQEHQHWLEDYCLYAALKKFFKGQPWYLWEPEIRDRQEEALAYYRKKLVRDMEYHCFLQYTFFTQWQQLKDYCQEKGISILGDLPIYVSHDSADTWVHRHLFALDDAGQPLKMAGVPPDYFSPEGQLWGNPIYRWDEMAREDYAWWIARIRHSIRLYDYFRLDHFRGFEGYWAVPGGEKTAASGFWYKGPGLGFFEALHNELGELPFIAEDLGVITPEVHNLKHLCGFPGMLVYQFSHQEMVDREPKKRSTLETADSESEYREPVTEKTDKVYKNIVYYTGTHDNDTLAGWCQDQKEDCSVPAIIEELYQSDAAWVIIPLQDLLRLGKEHRMNTPGTAEGNWTWRMDPTLLTEEIKRWLGKLAADR